MADISIVVRRAKNRALKSSSSTNKVIGEPVRCRRCKVRGMAKRAMLGGGLAFWRMPHGWWSKEDTDLDGGELDCFCPSCADFLEKQRVY